MMFIGSYEHNIDKKGRIIIPAKFREELSEQAIINRGLDGCINVYTQEQWVCIYEQLKKLPTTSKQARMYVRAMTSNATGCEIDAQGRILIPSELIAKSKLVKECRIIGAGDHVEIWAKEVWDAMEEEMDMNFEDIAEQMTSFMV